MFNLFRRLTTISGLVALWRSPTGQRLTNKAQAYLKDPRTQERITQLRNKFNPTR